jgi:hypothetical protein
MSFDAINASAVMASAADATNRYVASSKEQLGRREAGFSKEEREQARALTQKKRSGCHFTKYQSRIDGSGVAFDGEHGGNGRKVCRPTMASSEPGAMLAFAPFWGMSA